MQMLFAIKETGSILLQICGFLKAFEVEFKNGYCLFMDYTD